MTGLLRNNPIHSVFILSVTSTCKRVSWWASASIVTMHRLADHEVKEEIRVQGGEGFAAERDSCVETGCERAAGVGKR